MTKYFLFIVLIVCSVSGFAQFSNHSSAGNKKQLDNLQDSLIPYAKSMIMAQDASARFYADSIFIRTFVRALQVPHSFSYPFDSLNTVSKLYAPDSSFRIFTWQIERDESYFRQYGAIQMRTKDGTLNLFPLYDASDYTATPSDSVRSIRNWIGALYYGIVMKEYKGKKFYTLLGFDDNDFSSTKKWIEVLTFSDEGQPVFGGKFFDYKEDSLKPAQPAYRFCLEYKKDAKARMVYDPEFDMIIFDHLISETNEQGKKYTLIPEGEYEGFKWNNGKWVHVDNPLGSQQTKDKQAPVPVPFYDESGKPIKE